jgi:hypothetical protein
MREDQQPVSQQQQPEQQQQEEEKSYEQRKAEAEAEFGIADKVDNSEVWEIPQDYQIERVDNYDESYLVKIDKYLHRKYIDHSWYYCWDEDYRRIRSMQPIHRSFHVNLWNRIHNCQHFLVHVLGFA